MIDGPESFTCHYIYLNATSKVQVVRIANVHDWYFERVAFPGQQLLIEAKPRAVLEVYTSERDKDAEKPASVLKEKIPGEALQCVWL
jgi:Domain of unknown function (DUF1830)